MCKEVLGPIYTYKTSLRQAYDMTKDHLHAHDIFTYRIKYAKICTRIFGAKVLTHGKQIFLAALCFEKTIWP